MKMEILLEPTSNKLMVEHAEYDESNTYVLERFNTTAGNPVKKILLKLNLSDHRLFKDGGGDFRYSDTTHLSRSVKVLKLKNFKKDATLKLFKNEVASPQMAKFQELILSLIRKNVTSWSKKELCLDTSPNWNIPFELMCDASDFVVRAVLEFDIEIKDRKGTENVAADHLSRIENDESSDDSDVDENFLGETLMEINTKDEPWFADFANYLVADIIPKGMAYQQKTNSSLTSNTTSGKNPTSSKYVLTKLFCRFGMPKALISDRGTHFCNKIMKRTMKIYGVNHRFSTSYHPQTSGQVENTNIALKRILKKTVKDNPDVWSRKLDDALWAFRTSYKTPTGTTPYKLMYGKNCHLPFEIEHRTYWALKNCNPDLIAAGEKRMFQLHELDELRHQAYENSRLYKARTKV
ncbi:reverse transcriptase domain-containing protein [Tanacetum coccineum]